MTDALTEISREEERCLKIAHALDDLSLMIWHYAKMYPKGELREVFITDTLETVCEKISERIKSYDKP